MFDLVCETDNLAAAYSRARKGLKDKCAANIFAERFEHSLAELQESLRSETYTFGPYNLFRVRDPKDREIFVAPFMDRVVHHAINHHIEPVLEKSFINHSYACRRGKGNQQALRRLQLWIDGMPDTYVLKMDIKKYFASVDREILLRMVFKKIHDPRLQRLLHQLIFKAPYEISPDKGLPIGNLTSQTFGNLYLTALDHFVKDQLGTRHYLRYVDDFIILGKKQDVHRLRKIIVEFLGEKLILKVDPTKEKVLAAKNGIPFLGFVLKPNKRPRLQHQAIQRFLWKVRHARKIDLPEPEIAEKVISWFGYARAADVTQILQKANALKYVELLL